MALATKPTTQVLQDTHVTKKRSSWSR